MLAGSTWNLLRPSTLQDNIHFVGRDAIAVVDRLSQRREVGEPREDVWIQERATAAAEIAVNSNAQHINQACIMDGLAWIRCATLPAPTFR